MSERTRVLWLIKGLGPGGAERLLVGSARHIDRDRFDVHARYLLPWKDHLADELSEAGVDTASLDVRHPADPRWLGRLRDLAADYDVIHAHLPVAGIGARLATRGMKARPALVYTEHNTWHRYRQPTRGANALTFPMNDAAIAVSRDVASSIRARRPSVDVIENGVDVEAVREAALSRADGRAVLGLPADAPVVGTVGGLTPKKGHRVLVQAAARVLEQVPEALFVFVGLPVDPEPIEAEIAARGLAGRVVLAGYHAEAARLMRAFDVFCLPSFFEGLPVSLLEAMAVDVPVVATSVGGTPEVLESPGGDRSPGVMVAPGDPSALAGALVEMLVDHEHARQTAAAGRQRVERFDLAEMVRRTEVVVARVADARAGKTR